MGSDPQTAPGLGILAPRYVNRLMWRNSVFTANTLKFVKTDLHICGLDLEKLSYLRKSAQIPGTPVAAESPPPTLSAVSNGDITFSAGKSL